MHPYNYSHIPPAMGRLPNPAPNPVPDLNSELIQVNIPVTSINHHNVQPDGDCLFRCLHMGLTQAGAEASVGDIMGLRMQVLEYVHRNALILANSNSYFEGIGGVRALENLLGNLGQWNTNAGDLVTPLLAQILGRDIIVLIPSRHSAAYTLQYTFRANNPQLPPGRDSTGEPPIYLGYVAGGTHYTYLTLPNTPQANSPAQQTHTFPTGPRLTTAERASIEGNRFQHALQAQAPKIDVRSLESELQHWVNTGNNLKYESAARASVKDLILSTFRNNADILDLSRKRISSLPPAIGYLTNLKVLSCYGTPIRSLPNTIGNLTNLIGLNCSSTFLASLPDTIGNLTNLIGLNCSSTPLASLPSSIGNLKSLENLDCSNTGLVSLPETIGNLINLETLECAYTGLTSLPYMRDLNELRLLQLNNCNFSNIHLGVLPSNNDLDVHLENNRFSANTATALVRALANDNGPNITISIYDSPMSILGMSAKDIDQPLMALGYPDTKDLAALRKAIKPCDDMGNVANDFTCLLAKINNQTPKIEGELAPSIKAHLDNVLRTLDQLYGNLNKKTTQLLGKKASIKETIDSILAEATEANRTCVDRALVHLLKMSAKCSFNNAPNSKLKEAISQDIRRIAGTMDFINRLSSTGENKLVYSVSNNNFISPFSDVPGEKLNIPISDPIEDILLLLNSGLLKNIKGVDMIFGTCAVLGIMDKSNREGNSLVEAAKTHILATYK